MKPPQNSDLLKRLLEKSVKRLADEQRQRKDMQDGEGQSLKRRASEVMESNRYLKRKKIKEESPTDCLTRGLIFNFLKDTAPSIAGQFKDLFTFRETQLQLEEVLIPYNFMEKTAHMPGTMETLPSSKVDLTENFVKGLIFNFLQTTAPDVAQDFQKAYSFSRTLLQLQDVIGHFKTSPRWSSAAATGAGAGAVVKKNSKSKLSSAGKRCGQKNRSTGCRVKKFTQEEDEVIREAIAKLEKVGAPDCAALASRLNRGFRSIQARIESLRINQGVHRRRSYSFTEDCLILDNLIIPRLKREKLSQILLSNCHFVELASDLNRRLQSVRHRWEGSIHPCLLQYYAGTLNMEVEKMLANFIADTYDNFSEINWPEVAARADFAGHTEQSLKNMYFQDLLCSTRKQLGAQGDDVGVQEVADHVRGHQRTWRKNKEKWQQGLIAFFEKRVDDLGIEDFL